MRGGVVMIRDPGHSSSRCDNSRVNLSQLMDPINTLYLPKHRQEIQQDHYRCIMLMRDSVRMTNKILHCEN